MTEAEAGGAAQALAVEVAPVAHAPQRAKAKQKTPQQKSALEEVFASNQHPDELIRAELAQRLELTVPEITSWFQNKRRRMKNKAEPVTPSFVKDPMSVDGQSAAGQGSLPQAATGSALKVPPKVPRTDLDTPDVAMQEDLEFPPEPTFASAEEERALLQQACLQFPDFRSDGPPMSFHFDPPPLQQTQQMKRKVSDISGGLDAGHPAKVAKKSLDPHELLQKQLEDEEKRAKKVQLKADREQAKLTSTLKKEEERRIREADREKLRIEKEAMKGEYRAKSEAVKAEERRMKLLQKQKEKEAKEQARLQAKHDKEEARRAKLAQKEAQRIQAKQLKEKEKLEKKNQREAARKQKESERRTKASLALKLREVEPPDDLEIEMSALREQWLAEHGPLPEGQEPPLLQRPPFPPTDVAERLKPAFTGDLAANDCELGGNFLMIWSFIADFSPLIAFRPLGLQQLMEAVQVGSLSVTLVNLHIALIRFIQSEAEIANAIGSVHVGMERMSQTVSSAAKLVTEALSWGFDVSTWRAHLNEITWPEVLRQLAIAAGWGPERCRPVRASRTYDERRLGEDIVEGEDGSLTFVWPSRFQPSPAAGDHTMKEACWKVLADLAKNEDDIATAAKGLPVREIARQIEAQRLRVTKSATIVEGSVAGALSRDSLFAYVAPGTYALQAIVGYWRKHKDRLERKARGEDVEGAGKGATPAGGSAEATPSAPATPAAHVAAEKKDREFEDEEEEEEEDDDHVKKVNSGAAWVEKLLVSEYDSLSLSERVEALADLLHLALELPSAHSSLDRHHEEVERQKKIIREEVKEERKNRQKEMAAKMTKDAEEAQARVTALRQKMLAADGDTEMAAPADEQPPTAAAAAAGAGEEGAKADGAKTPCAGEEGKTAAAQTAADAAVAKLKSQLEAVQKSEREATSSAAESLQRAALGKRLHAIEVTNAVRDEPVGMDRRCNRYRWYSGKGPGPQRSLPDRVLFEDGETGAIHMFTQKADVDALRAHLDPKGVREAALSRTWEFYSDALGMTVALRQNGEAQPLAPEPQAIALPPGPATWEAGVREGLQAAQFDRFLKLKTAGMTVLGEDGEVRASDFLATDCPSVKKLKSEMLCVESAIPEQAMSNPSWDRVRWIRKTQASESLAELRSLLGMLENNLRDTWICRTYIREPQLVKHAFIPTGREVAAIPLSSQHESMRLRPADVHPEINNEPLAWLPLTAAALMWRLFCLDAAVCYGTGPESRPWRERLLLYRYVQVPVLVAGQATDDGGSVATACSVPTYMSASFFPTLPLTAVPMDAVELVLDTQALQEADDEHLRSHVPAGLSWTKHTDASAASKKVQAKKKVKKKRPSDDDDVTRAADIISSDDDFDNMLAYEQATYTYTQHTAAYQSTPAASAAEDDEEGPADDPDDPSASVSGEDEEDDDDF